MELVRGTVKVEWVDLGEGWSGYYDPDNPGDQRLLRFDISRLVNGAWKPVCDASYCTRVPADAPAEVKRRGLAFILDDVYEPVAQGYSVKKLCERLSWIEPSWVESRDVRDRRRQVPPRD